jgi:hypothetical protein
MDNDYDFITFLIMNEYVDSNGAVLKNPSEKFIMCSKIMTEHNAHEHIEFLKAEKEKILEKIRKCNYITITKIMISIIVLSLFLFII